VGEKKTAASLSGGRTGVVRKRSGFGRVSGPGAPAGAGGGKYERSVQLRQRSIRRCAEMRIIAFITEAPTVCQILALRGIEPGLRLRA
jgi:hypothetical protein